MPSSKVSVTFVGARSPYIIGDVASFPQAVADKFVKQHVAVFTNPELVKRAQALRRVRLDTPSPVHDRRQAIHGSITSGKDFHAKPDEFDMAMTHSEKASDLDEEQDPSLKRAAGEPDPVQRASGSGSLRSQDSPGHSVNVGEHADDASLAKESGIKSKAESAALAAGTDPAAAGEAAEKEKQAAEVAAAAAAEEADEGTEDVTDVTTGKTTKRKRSRLT